MTRRLGTAPRPQVYVPARNDRTIRARTATASERAIGPVPIADARWGHGVPWGSSAPVADLGPNALARSGAGSPGAGPARSSRGGRSEPSVTRGLLSGMAAAPPWHRIITLPDCRAIAGCLMAGSRSATPGAWLSRPQRVASATERATSAGTDAPGRQAGSGRDRQRQSSRVTKEVMAWVLAVRRPSAG